MQINREGALPIRIRVIHTALGTALVHHCNTTVAELIYEKNLGQYGMSIVSRMAFRALDRKESRRPREVALLGERRMIFIRVRSVRNSDLTVSRAMVGGSTHNRLIG